MKKVLLLSLAGLMFTGVTMAEGGKKKKCAKGKSCCHGKHCCKKKTAESTAKM